MPIAAPRVCACGAIVSSGEVCPCQRKRRQETKARSDAKRPNATARGYTHEWRKEARAYLALNPRCQYQGCTAYAVVVDHRIAHRGDKTLFWDRRNWQGLCVHHHSATKQRFECR